jgi:hypothetical protein
MLDEDLADLFVELRLIAGSYTALDSVLSRSSGTWANVSMATMSS